MELRWFDRPKHFLISPCRTFPRVRNCTGWWDRCWTFPNVRFPTSCVCVALESDLGNGPLSHDIVGAVFELAAYSTLIELLDDLFIYYLKESFSPLTYGKEWILVQNCSDRYPLPPQVIAPWSWLESWGKGSPAIARHWATRTIRESGLSAGDRLEVVTLQRECMASSFYGLATSSKELHALITTHPKASQTALGWALTRVPVEGVNREKYPWATIHLMDSPDPGSAWVESDGATDFLEEWGGYWDFSARKVPFPID
jgi:hypothetical protein